MVPALVQFLPSQFMLFQIKGNKSAKWEWPLFCSFFKLFATNDEMSDGMDRR